MLDKQGELRCFCSRRPLLATYGIEKGQLYVHVRVYKQHRIYGEVIVSAQAKVRLRCRECLRWQQVTLVQPDAKPRLVEIKPDGDNG